MASRRRVSGAIRSLVLQVDCARILHETLLMPFFMYGSNTMMWREKERSMIMVVQMENLRGLLGIRSCVE